jgi:hypothetical protein
VFSWATLSALCLSLFFAACGEPLKQLKPTEPLSAREPSSALKVEVAAILLSDDVARQGVAEDAVVGVSLRVRNDGGVPYTFNASSCWLFLEGDERRPEKTLSFAPAAGGEGAPPTEVDEDAPLRAVAVAPGETRMLWVLFRGYRFPDSDIARRVTMTLPGLDGQPLHVLLADPARADQRWEIAPPTSRYMPAIQSASLLGAQTKSQIAGSALARVATAGRFLWDVELRSGLAVQTEGRLKSALSTFSVSALALHLTAPLWTWGPYQDPTRFGVFAGGGGAVWSEVMTTAQARAGEKPNVYGAWFVDGGLELDFGTWRPAATPFPLYLDPKPGLPRWSLRLGYTQSWFGSATSAGYMSGLRLSF